MRKGNALSFDVVPLLGLLPVTEKSRFIMRKGFAQAVSIAVGSTALTTAAAPLSQPSNTKPFRSTAILISELSYERKNFETIMPVSKGTSGSNKGIT